MAGIVRRLLDLGAWYSKGKSHHAEKYGNYVQGIVGDGGLVSPDGSLYIERRCGDVIGMCNLEVISQKGGICWTSKMVHHEEIPDGMGQYIWIRSVGNG